VISSEWAEWGGGWVLMALDGYGEGGLAGETSYLYPAAVWRGGGPTLHSPTCGHRVQEKSDYSWLQWPVLRWEWSGRFRWGHIEDAALKGRLYKYAKRKADPSLRSGWQA